MKIGVRVPCYRRWCGAAEVRAIAETAEALGFDSLWVQDHLVAPVGSDEETAVQGVDDWMSPGVGGARTAEREVTTLQQYYAGDDWWLEPFSVWGFLAAITERVTLASDIVVVPYRNPVVQAKMLITLDILSGGRMLLGTGTGHVAAESNALGVDFEVRGSMHDEYLRVMKAVMSSDETAFEGEHVRFGPTRTLGRPVQTPHPPIYVGGNGKRSIRRAVELGDGWLPSAATPEGLELGIAAMRDLCERTGRSIPPVIALSLPNTVRMPSPGREDDPRTTPAPAVIELLHRYRSLGVEHVSLSFPMPSAAVYLQQIESFAREVLPAVH